MLMPIDKRTAASLLVLFFLTGLVICGCKQGTYSFRAFSYPPNSQPHEDNWEYLGKVFVVSPKEGPLTQKSKKNVRITVENENHKIYLSDELSFVCGNIEPSVHWDRFDEIEIILSEVGNQFANDEYNRQLVERGPKRLAYLKYVYDPDLKQFRRTSEH